MEAVELRRALLASLQDGPASEFAYLDAGSPSEPEGEWVEVGPHSCLSASPENLSDNEEAGREKKVRGGRLDRRGLPWCHTACTRYSCTDEHDSPLHRSFSRPLIAHGRLPVGGRGHTRRRRRDDDAMITQ